METESNNSEPLKVQPGLRIWNESETNPVFSGNVPEEDELTLAELHNTLATISRDDNSSATIGAFRACDGVLYPHVSLPDLPSNVRTTKTPYLTSEKQNERSLTSFANGLLTAQTEPGTARALFYRFANTALNAVGIFAKREVSPVQSPIRAFAWHLYKQIFAVGFKNDSIAFYDVATEAWTPVQLTHEYQKDVFCMEWRPLCGNTLAVACRGGVLLWNLFGGLNGERAGDPFGAVGVNPWAEHLNYPGHAPVTTLSWSPDGRFLATGSPNDSAMVIWDVILGGVPTAINKMSGVALLRWSPDGNYLFAAYSNYRVRIWETQTWSCVKIPFAALCTSASWSPDGKFVAISLKDDSSLYIYGNKGNCAVRQPTGPVDVELKSGKEIRIGGPVKQVVWDQTGERLACAFEADENAEGTTAGKDLVALYDVNRETATLIHKGFIRGPPAGNGAVALSFKSNVSRGALLTICWANGKISFYPLYFVPSHRK